MITHQVGRATPLYEVRDAEGAVLDAGRRYLTTLDLIDRSDCDPGAAIKRMVAAERAFVAAVGYSRAWFLIGAVMLSVRFDRWRGYPINVRVMPRCERLMRHER